ncbi:hypothetical protein HDU76_008052, partial [Blyttiomyces sp. JEL0837]
MVLSASFRAALFLATTFTTLVNASPLPYTNTTLSMTPPPGSVVWARDTIERPPGSVVWADDLPVPLGRRQVTTPNPIPSGCSLFDNNHLNIAERLPGWQKFLQAVASDLGVG